MKQKILSVIFILVLGSVATSALVGIRNYSYPRIQKHQEKMIKTAILKAASIKYEEDDLNKSFDKNIKNLQKNGFNYYLSPDNYYIYEFSGNGLWGLIDGVITLDADLVTIKNIKIISQEETPGLGGRISEENYLNQFKDKKASPQIKLVLRRRATNIDEVDAISGATLSSQALVDMINNSIANFRLIIKE